MFVNRNFATDYFSNRLYSSAWDSASDSDKTKSVVMAERMIMAMFDFTEDAFFKTDGIDDCQEPIKYAICEQAIYLLSIDPTAYPEVLTMGIVTAASGASVTFDRNMLAPFIAPSAIRFIGNWGILDDKASDAGNIKSFSLCKQG